MRKGLVNDSWTSFSGMVEADERRTGGPVQHMRGPGGPPRTRQSLAVNAVESMVFRDKNGEQKEKAGCVPPGGSDPER
jgi:hypothetical protein